MPWLSEVIRHPDPASLSALAACAAAAVALTGATFQFFIGRRQARAALISAQAALENAKNGETSAQAALINAKNAGRYKIAEFRQAWIYKVIDTICEHNSILMAKLVDESMSVDERQKLIAARTRLEILLNPVEDDSKELLAETHEAVNSKTDDERCSHGDKSLVVARRLLKREWARIKGELSHLPS